MLRLIRNPVSLSRMLTMVKFGMRVKKSVEVVEEIQVCLFKINS